MVATATATDIGVIQVHGAGFAANRVATATLPDPELVSRALTAMGITTFARRLKGTGLILAGPKSAAVILHGVDNAEESLVTVVHERIAAGAAPAAPKEVMIGQGLARALGVTLTDPITIMTQDQFGAPATRRFTVCGIFHTGVVAFDQNHLFLTLPGLQGLLDAEGLISEIAISVPMAGHGAVAERLQQSLGTGYQVEPWEAIAPDVTQLIALNDTTMLILIAIVFLIVGMGIVNTMTTIIFERFREFGTIAALGCTPAGIMGLVSAEALALGLAASLLGSVVGLALCLYLAHYGIDLTAFTSSNQYFSNNHVLKAVLTWQNVATSNGFTLLSALIAGIYPAWSAARQDPAQALAHH
jgi:ABC-type lipoprotein release transport system permease subunit